MNGSSPQLKPLPVGIQSFTDLINGGYLYVDKTESLYEMVRNPKGVYFLSRPRRFGKSLLISTLEALFRNYRELFHGLWIDSSNYQWQKFPVIRIDMAEISKNSGAELSSDLKRFVFEQAKIHSVSIPDGGLGAVFTSLIAELYNKYQKQVVVLVDEYDKAIVDNITNTQIAKECRDILREFYTILKSQDENLRFVFLTGVSKFSKMSIFSGLNNLEDISFNSEFASICGYTQEELSHYFKDYIEANGFQNYSDPELLRNAIRDWYNGYRFSPYNQIKVYNPFSTLLLFKNKIFQNYWFATGTPKFLIDIIEAQKYTDIEIFENLEVAISDLEKFDLDSFHLPSIMFQAGYLTIKDYRSLGAVQKLTLDYPNMEVRHAFINEVWNYLSQKQPEYNSSNLFKLLDALNSDNLDEFFAVLKSYMASIPYGIQVSVEKYYQTLIYMICRLVSDNFESDVQTNVGRIDMLLVHKDIVYVFEFKLNSCAKEAITQIREKRYYEKYLHITKEIKLIGVNFSTQERNIDEWIVESL